MKFNTILLFYISKLVFATLHKKTTPTDGCHADNCLRAIRATSQAAQATLDCSSFLLASVSPPPITVTVTATVTNTLMIGGKAKRAPATISSDLAIPCYASACTNAAEYSSACYCIGVTGATTTLAGISTTITVTATSAKTASATPTCTAEILSDTSNCGKCGVVCPSGSSCENGSCTSTPCSGETCASGFANCDPNNVGCFCFTNAKGVGFCGQNAVCAGLTPCATDVDCNVVGSSGNICALHTCCVDTGVCLAGQCGNPSTNLMRMAREVKRNHLGVWTAAFGRH